MKWGARIDGEVYGRSGDAPWDSQTWSLFEAHANKRVSTIHWGQPLGAFDLPAANKVRSARADSLISYDTGGFTLAQIAAGDADWKIDTMAQNLAAFGSVAFLRLWWEMNGSWYSWGRSPDYIPAWQRVVDRTREVAPNARFVWCPNTVWDTGSAELNRWYPGPEYVDWVGVDGYNRNEPWKSAEDVFGPTLHKLSVLDDTAPWMICETGCTEAGGDKAAWIANFLGSWLPKHKRIKRLYWFNWGIQEASAPGGRWDWQIESSPEAEAAFRQGIGRPYYA